MILLYVTAKTILFGKYAFYYNELEMTGKVCFTKNRTFFEFVRFFPMLKTQSLYGDI